MGHAVFVSYVTGDQAKTAQLCTKLAARDIDVAIASGADDTQAARQEALDAATHVVLVISPASVDSAQVQAEVARALKGAKPVVPVLLADAEIPEGWLKLQPLDMRGGGAVEAVALDSLVKRLPKKSVTQLQQLLETPDQTEVIRKLILTDRLRWLIGADALTPGSYLSLPETHELRSEARHHEKFGAIAQRTRDLLHTGNMFWYFYGAGGPGDELASYVGKAVQLLDEAPDAVRTIPWWFTLKMLGEKQKGALRLGALHTGTETGSANCAIFAFLSPYQSPFAEDGTPAEPLAAVLETLRAQIGALNTLVPDQPFTNQVFIRVYLVAGRTVHLKTPAAKQHLATLRQQWPQKLLPGQTALTLLKVLSYERLVTAAEVDIPLLKYG